MTKEVELLQYFVLDLLATAVKLGKRPIAWQDLFDSGVDLPKTTILDVWINSIMQASVFETTKAGYDVVVSACWYLDQLEKDWWYFYTCNPRGFANLNATQQAHILGGHASMWGELVDSTNFFHRVWPKTSATAEVLWSGSPSSSSDVPDDLVRRRLVRFRSRMVQQFDIPASSIPPSYCVGPSGSRKINLFASLRSKLCRLWE